LGIIIAFESGNPTASADLPASKSLSRDKEKINTIESIINYKDAHNYIDYKVKVKGNIAYVINNKKAIYLAFKKPHQGEFMVVIEKKHWWQYPNGKPDEYFKPGDRILVEGIITRYQGDPVIYINTNENIKKL
jgi:DNA/RNA endonuclease YhcR with UshA esterase domain